MKTIAIVTATALLLTPGVSLAQKSGGRPDASLEPNYGAVNLRAGFTPDPFTKEMLAGGSVQASAVKSGCEGLVSAAPDLQVNYRAGSADLTFKNTSDEDTTLLISGPNGRWYCDDDSGGALDPLITITSPQSGRYSVWVGTYGDQMAQSTLKITEMGADALVTESEDGPDISLTPNFGTVNLRAGFTPDPYTKRIVAGGSVSASRAKAGCAGKVSAAPDFQVFYDRAGDADLTFKVVSDDDTTLLINTPNGRFYCDDDSGGDLNPKVVITNPQNGRYDIWVGTYGDETVQSTLQVSELDD